MGIENVLDELGIEKQGKADGKLYVISLNDSDEEGEYYSLLNKNKDVEFQEDNSSLNLFGHTLIYTYKNFLITLYADYDEDEYKLVIKELF